MELICVLVFFFRSYWKIDIVRLIFVVILRFFGFQIRGILLFFRFYMMDDVWKYNGDVEDIKRILNNVVSIFVLSLDVS